MIFFLALTVCVCIPGFSQKYLRSQKGLGLLEQECKEEGLNSLHVTNDN